GRRDVADGLQQPAMVEPVDPGERRELDRLEAPPWPAPMDDLGLVEAVDRFGESVVIAVADAADRRLDARLGQALGVADADVLRTAIRVVDKTSLAGGAPFMQRLLQGVQHEGGMG